MKKLSEILKDLDNYGDLLLIANKGVGKTMSLMYLAQEIRKQPDTRVIIFEDFPKWCLEFDSIPYLEICDRDIVESKTLTDKKDIFLYHAKDYTVKRYEDITGILEDSKDCIFTMDIDDIERCAFFIYSIVQYFHRKAYKRKFFSTIKHEKIVFIVEEAQNIFDSSTISKKIFNRMKKIFSTARNMDIHFIMCSQRLQDLNTKIRGRMRLLIGQVSMDDYELKIHRLMRHSKYRAEVLTFDRGTFVYTPTDTVIKFPLFKAEGKPYSWNNKEEIHTLTTIENKFNELIE